MEAAPARDPALRISSAKLLREPLSWATFAAFVGAAVGLVGTFAQAAVFVSYTPDMSTVMFAGVTQPLGETLVALSLLGVPALLGAGPRTAGRRAAIVGGVLLLLWLAAAISIFHLFYVNMGDRVATTVQPSSLWVISYWVSLLLPSVVALPFAVAALFRRRALLGAILLGFCGLNVPFGMVALLLFPPDPEAYYEPSAAIVLFAWYGGGVSLLEAPLWALLGVMFLRTARERSYGEAERLQAEENRKRARVLYEEGFGRGVLSVVDELVSEDFRDLRRGARGKLGMERAIAELWASYPDLTVSVEDQESEGDLVRTRLLLSGTDQGGVMWYPPTGRRVSFEAEFVDRFSAGKLVEHGGSTDTGDLLRQLGLTEER